MSSSRHAIDILLRWCENNDIWIDPRLRIGYHAESGIGVYSQGSYIPSDTSREPPECPVTSDWKLTYPKVVHIHKNSVLSVRNCALSDFITPVISGPEAQLALSVALYVEL